MATTTYCVQADVEEALSRAGVRAFVDDDESGGVPQTDEVAHITRAIERAANRMNAILETRYKLSDLAGNDWARDCNADLAAWYLCSRRANTPAPAVQAAYDEKMETLIDIKMGHQTIPQQAESFNHLPTVSNYEPKRGAANQPIRVDTTESTGPDPTEDRKRKTNPEYNVDWY